jgi:hypothetical protein
MAASSTPEHRVWCRMRQRCHSPSSSDYSRYGGRGIVVCQKWRASFAAFLSDMGPRPSPLHTIERLDNDGPYSPQNCVWATRRAQTRNRSCTIRVTHDGVTRSLSEWAEVLGLSYWTLESRHRRGYSVEEILDAGSVRLARARTLTLGDETLSLSEWAARAGISKNALWARLSRGWPLSRAVSEALS